MLIIIFVNKAEHQLERKLNFLQKTIQTCSRRRQEWEGKMRLRPRRIGTKAKIYQSRIILAQTAIISNYHLSQGRTKEESKKEERKETSSFSSLPNRTHKKRSQRGKNLAQRRKINACFSGKFKVSSRNFFCFESSSFPRAHHFDVNHSARLTHE
jgi:hypothetical protein